ncbi:hypothetical protein K443DRAFT_684047, partial [Laccaria amethystina LaAM-08-1]
MTGDEDPPAPPINANDGSAPDPTNADDGPHYHQGRRRLTTTAHHPPPAMTAEYHTPNGEHSPQPDPAHGDNSPPTAPANTWGLN